MEQNIDIDYDYFLPGDERANLCFEILEFIQGAYCTILTGNKKPGTLEKIKECLEIIETNKWIVNDESFGILLSVKKYIETTKNEEGEI